jgi:hypothetical protein
VDLRTIADEELSLVVDAFRRAWREKS